MKKRTEAILLNTTKNTSINKEFNKDLVNNINNKENNLNKENISFSTKEIKSYSQKNNDKSTKKYNNKNVNELSNFVNKLINKNNHIEENIQKNINDNSLFNNKGENDLIIDTLNRRKKYKKINFNENKLTKKYSSTINIFPKNKINEINKTINGKKNNIPFPKTIKNKKQILERKNNYLNNRNYENKTYKNKMNKILNSDNNEITNFKNIKISRNEMDTPPNKLLERTKNYNRKNFIDYNKDKNLNFSYVNINEVNNIKEKKIILNKYIQTRNINNISKENYIFSFERLSKLKKSLIQNKQKVIIDKFINEDGTKDDISYKIIKRKYLSPKINSNKNKIHFLSISKNHINENKKNEYLSRIESNINFTKTILKNIKLNI